MIIPEWLLDERKKIQLGSHTLLRKKKVIIIWNTRKVQPLFNNKDKVKHHSCEIYHGTCSCDTDCIGEMIINFEIRWNEHIT